MKIVKEKLFVQIGDMFISTEENLHFHKGMSYQVCQIYHYEDGVVIYLKDKYGNPIPKGYGAFDYGGKLAKQMLDRQLEARVRMLWNSKSLFTNEDTLVHRYDFEKIWFYDSGIGPTYIGDNVPKNPEPKGRIKRYHLQIDHPDGGGWRYHYDKDFSRWIFSFEDYLNFFKEMIKENKYDDIRYHFLLPHQTADTQEYLDFNQYLVDQKFNFYDEDVYPRVDQLKSKYGYEYLKGGVKNFITHLSNLIFDKPFITEHEESQIIEDIAYLFRDLPSSHGSTSVTKVLLGKSKIKNSNADPYFGKYKDFLKYDQLFELVSLINSYMYHNDIFKEKESYSSGEEWRGEFEFIGNKTIDINKLKEFIKEVW